MGSWVAKLLVPKAPEAHCSCVSPESEREQRRRSQPQPCYEGDRQPTHQAGAARGHGGSVRKVLLVKRRHGLSNAYLVRKLQYDGVGGWRYGPRKEGLTAFG